VIVLDSSFLISLFLRQDFNHAKAMGLFEKHRTDEMLLTDEILFETLSVLNRKESMEFTRAAYERILSNSKLTLIYLNENERKEILAEFLAQNTRLSLADVSVVHACKRTLSAALSFDRHLLKAIGN